MQISSRISYDSDQAGGQLMLQLLSESALPRGKLSLLKAYCRSKGHCATALATCSHCPSWCWSLTVGIFSSMNSRTTTDPPKRGQTTKKISAQTTWTSIRHSDEVVLCGLRAADTSQNSLLCLTFYTQSQVSTWCYMAFTFFSFFIYFFFFLSPTTAVLVSFWAMAPYS